MLNSSQLARTDANLLLLFDLLFEERNAGRAAARMNLSPSAVSHALRRLRAVFKDPLFIATPKGMMPTERAKALAPAVRDITSRIAAVIGSAEDFDPTKAVRRFRIGAPDAAISTLVPQLVGRIAAEGPSIDLSVVQILPRAGASQPDHAWRDALALLESGGIELAILPHIPLQARFHAQALYSEDFVILARRGHAFVADRSLAAFVAARHVLVSASGDRIGYVDGLLAERGLERRIALTVPNFFMAASAIESSDLIGALPRHFAEQAARSFQVELVEPPIPMPSTDLHAIVPKEALLDGGVVWLLEAVSSAARPCDS